MGFKRKVFQIIIGGFSAMIAILLILSQFAFGWISDSIARQEVLRTFHQAAEILNNDLKYLEISVADWSAWDASYEYVLGRNPDFESENLQESAFGTLRLSSFSIWDGAGRPLFRYPEESAAFFEPLEPLRESALLKSSASSIVELAGAFHFASAHAVTRSDGSGTPAGTIVMTRAADRAALSSTMSILDSEIALEKPAQGSSATGQVVLRLPDGKYESFGRISDGFSPSGAMMRVRLQNRFITFPLPIFVAVTLTILLVLPAVTGLILLVLDRNVIRRIDRIGKELEPVASTGKHHYRVTVEGDDEISRLGIIMNRTLDSLEKSFAERESLFQEIRHRVKNNLQVVASLLNLQANETQNRETAAALRNSRRRVLAMAFVHEELYCSATLNSIDLHDCLERLTRLIRHTLDPEGAVDLKIDAAKLDLSIEKAVPFALIANEVLCNAFQHAFPARDLTDRGGPRTVSLSLAEENPGSYVLVVEDNGRGIKELSEYKGTLGLLLINALSRQLISRYEYSARPDGGTVFRLAFASA